MNETGNPTQEQFTSPRRAIGPAKSSSAGRRMVVAVVVVAVVIAGVLVVRARIAKSGTSASATYKVQRSDLTITVTEGGSIRAGKSIEYKCEVQRRGGDVTILSIVPAGTYITQEDVDNGMVLVRLDSSSLEETLTREKMELASASQSMTSAREAFEIQKIQNESDKADGLLQVRFAMMDLQRYLGNKIAEQLTADSNAITDLSERVAPILEMVKKDPNILDGSAAGQELKRLNDEIVLAQGNLKNAQNTLLGTERLHQAKYVSDLDLERDRLTVINRQFALENAIVNRDLFMRYDFAKDAERYLSAYIEAGRKLERTYAQCRSRLAQAQATLNSAEERYRSQELLVKEQEQQIANCTIRAKGPGLVIYGTGSSADAFRMMRGRGGSGGSGMIAEGETVFEGQTIISTPNTASMIAEISVHETEVDKVRVGQYAEIVMDAFPDKRLTGRVIEVAPLPDQQQGFLNPDLKVYKTLVSIDGTHDFLKTRMSCKVEILVQQLQDVITVPIQVVANRRGKKVVYVKTPSGVQEREVVTGVFNDTFVQILEGLDEGEEVLLNPPLLAENAAPTLQQRMRVPDGEGMAPPNGINGTTPPGPAASGPGGLPQPGAERPMRPGSNTGLAPGSERPEGFGPRTGPRPEGYTPGSGQRQRGTRPEGSFSRPEGMGADGGAPAGDGTHQRSGRPEGFQPTDGGQNAGGQPGGEPGPRRQRTRQPAESTDQ
ncbi:MAG TPA: efflux RND transporter periplasmic adaptor subunit [Anaerohalosphaeraceae bacterium]|jgi:HlyD family secretion protein|nr:efflux RND transporter periplasmic adaptor subunit [Anaerohalosphaeraceae bacterium]HRT51417.1 efflux RND transporter periplasmic adaptor subunit [Anaerohalosphaeraceae bacterium]HRT87268.1 efflux RND transporter periplasmic adaptor subunit [Anaerohalosphaeraceae bacterium]